MELSRLMERVVHRYNQVENKKRTYGTDLLLSRAEIHTIVAIGDYPMVNITTLAKIRGITKGAASQMVYKLVDKGMIEKKISPDSDTEVILTLTEIGKINYENHLQYHKENDIKMFEMLQDVPDELYDQIKYFLTKFDKSMDERLEE